MIGKGESEAEMETYIEAGECKGNLVTRRVITQLAGGIQRMNINGYNHRSVKYWPSRGKSKRYSEENPARDDNYVC